MKKFFFLLCLLAVCWPAIAQTSGLYISSHSKFYASLQNQLVNDDTTNNIYLLGLPSRVDLRLRIYTGGVFVTMEKSLSLESGKVTYYEIVTRPGFSPELRFIKYGNAPVFAPNPGPGTYQQPGVDAASFDLLLQKIKDESFDRKRVEMANAAVENSHMTSAQIRDIAKIFDFDRYRLEFAQHAWHYVYDKGMYLLVYDTFDFPSYVSDLKQYMKEHP